MNDNRRDFKRTDFHPGGVLDIRYYTEDEIDALLSGGAEQLGGDFTAITLATDWANYTSNYRTAKYKVVGDFVYVEAMIKRTTGSTTTMFTLPTGARPAENVIVAAVSADAFCRVSIYTDGNCVLTGGTPGTWVDIGSIWFKKA